jgi:hypothetical protein
MSYATSRSVDIRSIITSFTKLTKLPNHEQTRLICLDKNMTRPKGCVREQVKVEEERFAPEPEPATDSNWLNDGKQILCINCFWQKRSTTIESGKRILHVQ